MLKRFYKLILNSFLLTLIILSPNLLRAEQKSKTKYSTHLTRTTYQNICAQLQIDNRLESFLKITERGEEQDPVCDSCRNFFKTFRSTCRAEQKKAIVQEQNLKKKQEKEEEHKQEETATDQSSEAEMTPAATPEPTPEIEKISWEPSTELINLVTIAFRTYSEPEAALPQRLPIVKKLIILLDSKDARTKAESEYFGILASYIRATFEKAFELPITAQSPSKSSADSLFE